jgi:hypothetical protein
MAQKPDTRIITAEHPKMGTLYAAIDPRVHHVAGRVAERRFGAFLAPFPDEICAIAALRAAGAKNAEVAK